MTKWSIIKEDFRNTGPYLRLKAFLVLGNTDVCYGEVASKEIQIRQPLSGL